MSEKDTKDHHREHKEKDYKERRSRGEREHRENSKESNEIVYLNIGGYKYVTDRVTLCKNSNYFTGLMSDKFTQKKDKDGYIFINRPGKYFEPLLEYLMTDEIIIPEGMSHSALSREAAFYCIDLPINEWQETLSVVNDAWLADRFEDRSYRRIAHTSDAILKIVVEQFKIKAEESLKIESDPFLVEDQTLVNKWLDQTEFGNEYWRFEFIDRQKKLYSQNCVVNDEYFALLNDKENQYTIINYCKHHYLTVDIIPVKIHEPGVVGRHYFTVGYKFVHLPTSNVVSESKVPNKSAKKKRNSTAETITPHD